jgi:hypothetical protein
MKLISVENEDGGGQKQHVDDDLRPGRKLREQISKAVAQNLSSLQNSDRKSYGKQAQQHCGDS